MLIPYTDALRSSSCTYTTLPSNATASSDLQDVHDAALDGVLDVDQPHHAQRPGKGLGVAPHLVHLPVSDQIGRQDAGGIARVNPGILDVLHHPADYAARAVGDRVNVRLERVFEEMIDQHRMFRRNAR